jgi:hypothetical protein
MANKTPSNPDGCKSEEPSGPAPASEAEEHQRPVAPVRQKIGEAAGNLRQRSDWFRKRTGEP